MVSSICFQYPTTKALSGTISGIHLNPGKLVKMTKRFFKIDKLNPTIGVSAYNTEFYGYRESQRGGELLLPSANQDAGDYMPSEGCIVLNYNATQDYDYVMSITYDFTWIRSDGSVSKKSPDDATSSFYLANGCTLYGDGTQAKKGVQFGGDKGYATTKTLVDLVNNKNFSDDADGKGLAGLRSHKIKAMFSGSWDYDAVKKALGKNFAATQLPTVKIGGKDQQLKSFAGSKAIGVNPKSKNMEVAVKLAAYLGGEKAQKDHYTLRSIIPCNTALLKEKSIASDPLIKAQNDTINNTSVLQPTIAAMNNYWTPVETFGKALVAKQVTTKNYKAKTDAFQKSLNSDASK